MPADSEPLAVITIIASFFLDSDCRHYALWTAPGPELIRVYTYLASWPFSVGFQAGVERPSTRRPTDVKIVADKKDTQLRATTASVIDGSQLFVKRRPGAARNRIQVMGVHQSSGQFTRHLRAQMNQGRHLSLPHTCARSLPVVLSFSRGCPGDVLTSLQGLFRTRIAAVEDARPRAAGSAIEVPARITPSQIPSAGRAPHRLLCRTRVSG
jgi:hypothetical protein